MKRSGFTLVELIFVIVIIGVLAAVAVPRYQNLKQNAEVKNLIKTTIDAANAVPSSFVNLVDLEEENAAVIRLDDLVALNGKGWTYSETAAGTTDRGIYSFRSTPTAANDAAIVEYYGTQEANRTVNYQIICANFTDAISIEKCNQDLNNSWVAGNVNQSIDVNITF